MSGHLNSLSDEVLARMAQKGDRAAFELLCERTLPAVYNRLRALLPPDAVEDVTQEVFLAAMRGALFRTWIAGIVRHKVADYYRQRSRQPEMVPLNGKTNNATARDSWEERVAVRIALLHLPAHYQEVLLLRFAEGLPFIEVAQTLGISLEAAKSRYRRAVAAVAREMGVERR